MSKVHDRRVAYTLLLVLAAGCVEEGPKGLDSGDSAESATLTGPWYPDADGDGHGDADAEGVLAGSAPAGHVASADDCDDASATVYPGAPERCNAVDDDCDGATDEDAVDLTPWYTDLDLDGYGDPSSAVNACEGPAGWVDVSGDCDDADAGVNPAAMEVCDGVDQDCDGVVDDDPEDGETWYPDADGDGYGDASSPTRICAWSEGWQATGEDCDDAHADAHPGGTERCNARDDDCDGGVDEDDDGDDRVDSLCTLWEDQGLAEADVKIRGDAAYDDFGWGVAFVGDTDGDGIDDVAGSANEADLYGTGSGAVYVFAGPLSASGLAGELATATLAGPSAWAEGGTRVAAGGDANGDGYADVWSTSPFDSSGTSWGGSAALMYGPLSGTLYLSEPDVGWYAGEGGNTMGSVVDGHADYDGDGLSDVVLGALKADGGLGNYSGKAWIALATDASGVEDLQEASITLLPGHTNDMLGMDAAFVGDTTGDGTEDVVVTGLGDETTDRAGLVWVLEETLSSGSWTITDIADATLQGETSQDTTGTEVRGLGDMNGDGYADVAVGGDGVSLTEYRAGGVYVLWGPVGDRTSMAEADALLLGRYEQEMVHQIGSRGDVDGDSTPDLLIGGYNSGTSGELAGRVYLMRGPVAEGTSLLEDVAVLFEGEHGRDWAGFRVDIAGDANADGFADLLIGAPLHLHGEDDDEKWGAAYLFYGQP